MFKISPHQQKASALIALLLIILFAFSARADDDMQEMSQDEMASACGGFTLPNGVELNVGIENQISVNGSSVADSQLLVNGNTVTQSSTGTTQIVGANGGVTSVVQLSAAGLSVITNTANGQNIAVTRTLSLDLVNVSMQRIMAMNSAVFLQSQVLNGLRNSTH